QRIFFIGMGSKSPAPSATQRLAERDQAVKARQLVLRELVPGGIERSLQLEQRQEVPEPRSYRTRAPSNARSLSLTLTLWNSATAFRCSRAESAFSTSTSAARTASRYVASNSRSRASVSSRCARSLP